MDQQGQESNAAEAMSAGDGHAAPQPGESNQRQMEQYAHKHKAQQQYYQNYPQGPPHHVHSPSSYSQGGPVEPMPVNNNMYQNQPNMMNYGNQIPGYHHCHCYGHCRGQVPNNIFPPESTLDLGNLTLSGAKVHMPLSHLGKQNVFPPNQNHGDHSRSNAHDAVNNFPQGQQQNVQIMNQANVQDVPQEVGHVRHHSHDTSNPHSHIQKLPHSHLGETSHAHNHSHQMSHASNDANEMNHAHNHAHETSHAHNHAHETSHAHNHAHETGHAHNHANETNRVHRLTHEQPNLAAVNNQTPADNVPMTEERNTVVKIDETPRQHTRRHQEAEQDYKIIYPEQRSLNTRRDKSSGYSSESAKNLIYFQTEEFAAGNTNRAQRQRQPASARREEGVPASQSMDDLNANAGRVVVDSHSGKRTVPLKGVKSMVTYGGETLDGRYQHPHDHQHHYHNHDAQQQRVPPEVKPIGDGQMNEVISKQSEKMESNVLPSKLPSKSRRLMTETKNSRRNGLE